MLILLYKIAFVKASTYISEIMLSLAESGKTPNQLSRELGIHCNVSATLKQLKDKELVEVVNSKVKMGEFIN